MVTVKVVIEARVDISVDELLMYNITELIESKSIDELLYNGDMIITED